MWKRKKPSAVEQGRSALPAADGAAPAIAGAAESAADSADARRRRRTYTVEEKRRYVEEHHASDRSVEDFCAQQGVSRASLTKWRKELGYAAKRQTTRGKKMRIYTPEERRAAVEAYAKSGRTREEFAKLWGCSAASLDKWRKLYEEHGPKGLEPKPRGKRGPRPAARTVPDAVRDEICVVQEEHPHFGLRRIRDFLKRFRGAEVSTGTVRNVLRERGVPARPTSRKRPRARVKPPRRFERARPGQMWQTDITSYVHARSGRRVYLTVYLDDHSRYVVSWALASTQRSDLVIDPLLEGIARFGKPEEVLSDQGRQYFAWRGKSRFQKLLAKEGIQHVVSRTHHPQTLGKCERLWKTIFEEFWERAKPADLTDARERFQHWIAHYNHFRPHQGIDGAVPADRFFGAENALRESLEARLAEGGAQELDLALQTKERQPVYLFGQIGGESVSLHGEQGRLVIQTSNGKRRELGLDELGVTAKGIQRGEQSDERSSGSTGRAETETQKDGTQENGVSAAGSSGTGSEGALDAGERSGATEGARGVHADAGVLAREEDEAGGGGRAGSPALESVATEPTGGVGYARGALEAAPATQDVGGDREHDPGERSGALAAADPRTRDEAVEDRRSGACAADRSMGCEGEHDGGGQSWSSEAAARAGQDASVEPNEGAEDANTSERCSEPDHTAGGSWRRWWPRRK